jgi:hypothetical protein
VILHWFTKVRSGASLCTPKNLKQVEPVQV